MGQVEIFPDQLMVEYGSKTLGGGAGSSIIALNDASDATYIQAAGTLAQTYRAYYRFGVPVIPMGAAVRGTQLRIRYSHFTRSSTTYEYWKPVTVLVGRNGFTAAKPMFDAFHPGERFVGYSLLTTPVQQATFPLRIKDWSGKYYMGERFQMLPLRRLWASLEIQRKTAVNLARVYAMSIVITYDEKPTTTLVNPSGTEVVARPPFDFDWSDPDGQQLNNYDVRVYTQAMANGANFDIEDMVRFKPVYRRVIISNKPHHDPVIDLGQDGAALRAFVRGKHLDVWQPGRNYFHHADDMWLSPLSEWDSNDFTIDIAPPGQPEITATYDSVKHGIDVHVVGTDNMLPWDVSSYEPTTLPVLVSSNTTLTRQVTQFLHGSASLRMERTTSVGDANAAYPAIGPMINTTGILVTPGDVYTGRASFRAAAASGRTCRVVLNFFDALGNSVAATNTQQDVLGVTTGWREAYTVATAPTGAKWVQLDWRVLGCAIAEQHFVDQVGVFPGRRTNLLTANQGQLETDTTGWAGVVTTITRTTAIANRGVASLQLQKTTSTGTARAETPGGTSGVPVASSTSYTARAQLSPFLATRNAQLVIDWYTAAGALISSSTGSQVTLTIGGGWVEASVVATSPGTAAFARVAVEILATTINEVWFADSVGLFRNPGVVPDAGDTEYWSQGGWLSHDPTEHAMELERSVGNDEFGNPIWEVIPEPRVLHDPRQQMLEFFDYEVNSGVTASYRARITAHNPDDDVISSIWQTDTETMPQFTSWWLRAPLIPELSMPIRVGAANLTQPKPNTTDFPVGGTSAVMTHDGVKEDNLGMTIDLMDVTAYTMFRAMLATGDTLLLQDTFGRSWYVQADDGTEYEVMRAAKTLAEPFPTRHFHRVRVEWISVEKPKSLGHLAHAASH